MKRLLKAICLILAGISCLAFSACVDGEGDSKKIVVTLVYKDELSALETLIESTYSDIDFQQEVNVSQSIVDYRLRAGKGTDLVITSQPADRSMIEYVLPLGGYLFSSNYESTLMKSVSIDEINYYLPLPGEYWGYIVNKTLFEEASLDLPDSNDQIISSLKSLKAADIGTPENGYIFTMEVADNIPVGNFLVSCTVPEFLGKRDGIIWLDDLFNNKAEFDESNWHYGFDFPTKLIEEGLLNQQLFSKNVNNPSRKDDFASGKLAFAYGSSSFYEMVTRENKLLVESGEGEEYEYVMLPFFSNEPGDGKNWTVTAPTAYVGINRSVERDAKKLDACTRIMSLISSTEGQQAIMASNDSSISYLKRNVLTVDKVPNGLEQYVSTDYVYNIKFPGRLVEYLGKEGCDVLAGKKDAQTAMQEINDYHKNGSSDADYDMSHVGYLEDDLIDRNYSIRLMETALGNLIADSVAEYSGARIAVVNGGGIRASLYAGNVYGGDLGVVCPYDNKIIVVNMTGKTIREMLENSLSMLSTDYIPGGRFLQVSGIKYVFDSSKAVGQRLQSVTLADGTQINDNTNYQVAINDYMAGSKGYLDGNGDGFIMLNYYDDTLDKKVTLVNETNGTYADALKAYFLSHASSTVSSKVEGRITNLGATSVSVV